MTKIDRLTTHKNLKSYYKNGYSAVATYRTLRGDYGLYNCPTTQAIGKIVKKFKETGMLTNIEMPVHFRFARSIAIVSESVAEDMNVSFSGLSYGTF